MGPPAEGLDGQNYEAVALDVTQPDSVDQTVRVAASRGLDVLVNVAGGDTHHGSFEDTDDDVWRRMLELNLIGLVRCSRAAVPYLRRSSNHPAIVNVGSVNGLTALGSEASTVARLVQHSKSVLLDKNTDDLVFEDYHT